MRWRVDTNIFLPHILTHTRASTHTRTQSQPNIIIFLLFFSRRFSCRFILYPKKRQHGKTPKLDEILYIQTNGYTYKWYTTNILYMRSCYIILLNTKCSELHTQPKKTKPVSSAYCQWFCAPVAAATAYLETHSII